MKRKNSIALGALALAASVLAMPVKSQAQQAGTVTIPVEVQAQGWSVKKQLIGAPVYNQDDDKIGDVQDMIVAPDGRASLVIVGVGGFIGLGRHDVAVPVEALKLTQDRFVLAGGSRDELKAMPAFEYARRTEHRL